MYLGELIQKDWLNNRPTLHDGFLNQTRRWIYRQVDNELWDITHDAIRGASSPTVEEILDAIR